MKRIATETGTLDTRPPSMTFETFVETKFRTVHMPTQCRPATRERYEALFKQGIVAAFGKRRLHDDGSMPMRQYAATLAQRGIKPKLLMF